MGARLAEAGRLRASQCNSEGTTTPRNYLGVWVAGRGRYSPAFADTVAPLGGGLGAPSAQARATQLCLGWCHQALRDGYNSRLLEIHWTACSGISLPAQAALILQAPST